jgi:hypothetical protein
MSQEQASVRQIHPLLLSCCVACASDQLDQAPTCCVHVGWQLRDKTPAAATRVPTHTLLQRAIRSGIHPPLRWHIIPYVMQSLLTIALSAVSMVPAHFTPPTPPETPSAAALLGAGVTQTAWPKTVFETCGVYRAADSDATALLLLTKTWRA